MTQSRQRRNRAASPPGIEIRHARGCPAHAEGRCTCAPAFRAIVYSKRDARKIQKTFPTLSAAKVWRQDALVDLRRGKLHAPSTATLREIAQHGSRTPPGTSSTAPAIRTSPRRAGLRTGAPDVRPPGPGRHPARRASAPGRPGARRTHRADREEPVDGAQRPAATAGDLPPRGARGEIDDNPTRDRVAAVRGGATASPSRAKRRPLAPSPRGPPLGRRPSTRAPARRAPSPALGRHGPRRRRDPCPPKLGSGGRRDRAEVCCGREERSDLRLP